MYTTQKNAHCCPHQLQMPLPKVEVNMKSRNFKVLILQIDTHAHCSLMNWRRCHLAAIH